MLPSTIPRRLFREKEKNTIIAKVANCCRGHEPHLDFFFSFPGLFCSMRIGKLKGPERMNASGKNTRLSCTNNGFVGRSEILLTWACFSDKIKAGFGPLSDLSSPTVALNGLSLGGGRAVVGGGAGVTAQGRGDIKVAGELGKKLRLIPPAASGNPALPHKVEARCRSHRAAYRLVGPPLACGSRL